MRKKVMVQSVLLAALSAAQAQESAEIADLETLLDSASEIATKKSLNVDYLPAIVTVIEARTFREAGVQTLAEALDMLPGIQMQLSPMGYPITTVRGLKNPNAYLSDKIKLLIDGVAIHNEVAGNANFYMDFPIELVEKIEVLRGPGSTIYGAGSFYGTLNVITKKGNAAGKESLYAGMGSYGYRTLGGNANATAGEWKIHTDGYYQKNTKALEVEGADQKTDEAMEDFSVGLKAQNGGFELLARLKYNRYGNFYSFEEELDPIPEKEQYHANRYVFTQLSYKKALGAAEFQTKAVVSQRDLEVRANIYPIDTIASRFAKVGIDMQEGFFYRERSRERNLEAEAILSLPKTSMHDVMIGAGARRAEVTRDEFYSSVENAITENRDAILAHPSYDSFRYREEKESAFWADPTTTLLRDDLSRTLTYAYAQDLISVTPDIDLSLGVRMDRYSDFGTHWSKRAGLVYRASDDLIFKLLYGSAFRAPTLIEAYQNGHINFRAGDENICPEKTDTYEAALIYSPGFNHKFSFNFFYSKLKNVIDLEEYPNTDPGYQNFKERYSRGIEFEYFYRTAMEHDFYFNATYLDTQYTIPPEEGEIPQDQSMPDISKVMLKAMYVYRPTASLSFGTTWRYFSPTTETELGWVDSDATCDAVHIFDQSVSYRFTPQSEVRLSVKNLFDADVRQPSYYYSTDGGVRREGRNFFLSYIQTF